MLYEVETKKSLEQLDASLRAEAASRQFGVLAVHDLQAAMQKKGVAFGNKCLVYEVCNPEQAKKVLEANGAFSSMLPCRISVYSSGAGYRLSTILPSALARLFPGNEIEPVAREVELVVKEIMQAAAG